MSYYKRSLFFLSVLIGVNLIACGKNNVNKDDTSLTNTLVIGTTTTLEDSGLLSLLVSEFQKSKHITIKPIIAGSGQIHKLLAQGDLDIAITHDSIGEQRLVTNGVIKQPIALMKNDFIIVGPDTDQAKIKQALTPVDALNRIVEANALFISRGDNSGTYQMEQRWWEKAKRYPSEKKYLKTGTGMGATLNIAAERRAYTFVDRATWANFSNKQTLTPLFENPELMPNIYSLLIKHESLTQEKVILWRDWISQGQGHQLIINYRINGQPLFLNVR